MTDRWFCADDGRRLEVVPGFRAEVLDAVRQHTPRETWAPADYRLAARKRIARAEHVLSRLCDAGAALAGARVLEVGAGSGLDSVRIAIEGVELAVGIDRELALFGRGSRARLVRRLARRTLARLDLGRDIEAALASVPVRLAAMRADWLAFPDDTFDIVWSRTALEHVRPLDASLAEIARVLRPGGFAYHAIDPYFWVRGCHRKGVVDIPWAHARLTTAEIERFHARDNSRARAARLRAYLEDLNHLTCADWKAALERAG
ncbi:MAG: class I SAM-dependent methyltransferase, partial [Actinobacteria bacterium]|nr:class I SAM-dependent methyltransferase [Actinomycetota bacterium]